MIKHLVDNARDAVGKAGTISLAVRPVELERGEDGEPTPGQRLPYVTLDVEDSGCGMTPEIQTHLFEPFFTTKGPDRGTGLGLATVFSVVRRCGGFVDVATRPGSGSRFIVHLPRVVR